jgi:hypothetical protein
MDGTVTSAAMRLVLHAGLAAATLLPPAARAVPELVVLVRHGHKDAPVEGRNNFNLSETGLLQALRLSHLLPACIVPRQRLHLASYGFDLSTGKNARSYQTLVPLAVASGVDIRLFQEADQSSEQIGRQLLADPELSGGVLVVAWEHRRLPLLARGLGWTQMPRIDDDDFDRIWLLRYRPSVPTPEVSLLSQASLLQQDCFRTAPAGGHPLQRLAEQLLESLRPGLR